MLHFTFIKQQATTLLTKENYTMKGNYKIKLDLAKYNGF